jgi:hypothetical protein
MRVEIPVLAASQADHIVTPGTRWFGDVHQVGLKVHQGALKEWSLRIVFEADILTAVAPC